MESTQLSNFYRTSQQWPKSQMEISALVDELSRLLRAPFVAVQLLGDGETQSRLGFHFEDPKLRFGHDPKAPLVSDLPTLPLIVEDFLKKQLKTLGAQSALFKQIQISGELLAGYHLGFAPILTRERNVQRNHGWVVAAYPKAFSGERGNPYPGLAQRLVELAQIDHLDSEIQLRSQFFRSRAMSSKRR